MHRSERLLVAFAAGGGALLLAQVLPSWIALSGGMGMGLASVALARRLARSAGSDDAIPLASVSHEIRTPLNGILGLTQLLQKMQPTTQQREYLDAIQFSGQALMRLLNDILDYSRIRSRELTFEHETFSLRKWVRETVKSLAPQAHLVDLELSYWVESDVPDALIGDPNRLRQVLANLLVNAIQYTDSGEILLEVSRLHAGETEVELRVSVQDTGIGIDDASKSVVFDAFVRGRFERPERNDPKHTAGVGLGLAIVKQIVDGMGGRVEFSSEAGRGSTFSFTAPFEVAAAHEESFDEAVPCGEGLAALVVEDRPWAREVLRRQLVEWGFVVQCLSGAEPDLERLVRAREFSLLLLDSRIPGFGTWELAERLQAIHPTPGILMTMTQEYVDSEVLRSHGFLGHLTKPVAPSHLRRAVSILRRGSGFDQPEDVQTLTMERLALGGLRVLVAEDHPINRTIATRLLERAGCLVTAVENGREALDRVVASRYDIGVFDIQMPEMGGLELASAVRELERGAEVHLPLVALTAHAGEVDRDRCRAAGFDGFVAKPFQEQELVSEMKRAIDGTRGPTQNAHEREEQTEQESVSVPADGAAFDYETALKRADGDPALLAELSELYTAETPQTLRELDVAIDSGEPLQVERFAHRLKGALLMLAASPAAEAALALEEHARAGELDACGPVLAELRRELDRLDGALRELTAGAAKS